MSVEKQETTATSLTIFIRKGNEQSQSIFCTSNRLLQDIVMETLSIPLNQLNDFQYILDSRTPLDYRKTLQENGIKGVADIQITPKLPGGVKPKRTRRKKRRPKQPQIKPDNLIMILVRVNSKATRAVYVHEKDRVMQTLKRKLGLHENMVKNAYVTCNSRGINCSSTFSRNKVKH
jgi:hypothetical protein